LPTEPDSDKVFHKIRTFERSLLPRERASNPFTLLSVNKESSTMLKEKMAALAKILGKDGAEETVKSADELQAVLEAAGVRNKEVTTKDEEAAAQDGSASETDLDNLKAVVAEVLEEILAEVEPTEEGDEETPAEGGGEEVPASKKEYEAVVEQLNAMTTTLKEMHTLQTQMVKAYKDLTGDMPRGAKKVLGQRASASDETITTKKEGENGAEAPADDFLSNFLLAQPPTPTK
jgi:hypothetical protein